jgi:sugar phosphate isomerase/epimerase
MIRLAFSSNAFKKNTLNEAIETIAQIGYAGAEVMADVPHAYPPNMNDADRRAFVAYLRDFELKVSNVNAFTCFANGDTYHPTWIEDDIAKREFRIQHTLNSVELAAMIGAKTISLQPGGPLIGTTISRKLAGERFAEGLARVLPAAKRHDVILGIEPEPGLFIETAVEYLEFKNTFFRDESRVRMNCDCGHLFCVGEDPADVIRTMNDHVVHVHLEDIGKNRVHQHITPGKGVIDFPAIFAALDDVRYKGWVTVELYPYETSAAGVAKLAYEHLAPMIGG